MRKLLTIFLLTIYSIFLLGSLIDIQWLKIIVSLSGISLCLLTISEQLRTTIGLKKELSGKILIAAHIVILLLAFLSSIKLTKSIKRNPNGIKIYGQ